MFISVLKMVLPVFITFLLGYFAKEKQIIKIGGLEGLKTLVSHFTLPAVLCYAFATANYSQTIVFIGLTVFISCILGLIIGFALKKFAKPYPRYFPFLLTNFEGGMLGYSLFGLLYPNAISNFAMFDVGQTLCAFTVFITTLKAVNGEKPTLGGVLKGMISNQIFIAIMIGLISGICGIGAWLQGDKVGQIIQESIQFIAAPTSMIILFIVGYELNFVKELIAPVLKTVMFRVLVMGTLLIISNAVIFTFVPYDKSIFVAMLLAYSLPAPYIIPLFSETIEDKAYISTTLSIQTLLGILFFIGIAIFSLM